MSETPQTSDPKASGGAGAAPAAPRERRPRVFSGIQPTGALHLGNYLGAIRNYVAMQETHDCIYCVVDLHAITVRQQRAELRRNTMRAGQHVPRRGIDPERSIVIVQSHVPQHSELAWILNTVAYMGELRRMTQFKDKTGRRRGREHRRRPLRLPGADGGRHPALPGRRGAGRRGPEAARRAHARPRRALQQRLRQGVRGARAGDPRERRPRHGARRPDAAR